MNDTISRQWLMECVNEGWIKFDTEKDENRFIHLVRDIAPSAQSNIARDIATIIENEKDMRVLLNAQPRMKGEWIDNETSYADGVRQSCNCSMCGKRSIRPLGDFCRWCGADMRGEE